MTKERKLIIAGNWKMNKTLAEALTLVADLKRDLAGVKEVDVVYQTRIRPERVWKGSSARFAIDSSVLSRMKSDAMILHPLPRTVELDKTVDDDPRAMYFRQARNGLFVRMALLSMLLD